MKTYLSYISFFSMLVFGLTNVQAQKNLEKADLLFENQSYFEAVSLYEQYYEKSIDKQQKAIIAEKAGDCYFAFLQYEKACQWYEKSYTESPLASVNEKWADALWSSGQYLPALEKYKELNSKESSREKIKARIASCNYALQELSKSGKFEVSEVQGINTAWSEYSPFIQGSVMIFSSSRNHGKGNNIFGFDGQSFSDIYYAIYDSSMQKWTQIEAFPTTINSKFNEGTAIISSNNQLLFTRCNEIHGKGRNCKIYSSQIQWASKSAEKSLPLNISGKTINTGHPAVNSKGDIIFFVSDAADGLGGKDIYSSEKDEKGEWKQATNLGSLVNSYGDEMFPVIFGDTILYFASNGHIGMGGLDLFKVKISGSKIIGEIEALPYPINSAGDDFGIFPLGNEKGFFSSNRKNGKGSDDIYSYSPIPFILSAKGKVIDKLSGAPISKALIIVKMGSEIIDTTQSDESGDYWLYNLVSNQDYNIQAVKEGYIPQIKKLSTIGETMTRELSKANGHDIDFELFKVTRDEITINNIYYDFDKWDLRNESKIELDKIVTLLNENKEMRIQINSHTDDRGAEAYNLQLSANRAQSVVDYLVSNGISRERLLYKGWGETRLLIPQAQDEEQHQLNRRTTFNLINAGDFTSSYYEKIYDQIEAGIRKNKSGSVFKVMAFSKNDTNYLEKKRLITSIFPNEEQTMIIENDVEFIYFGNYLYVDDALNALAELQKNGFEHSHIAMFRNNKLIGMVKLQ